MSHLRCALAAQVFACVFCSVNMLHIAIPQDTIIIIFGYLFGKFNEKMYKLLLLVPKIKIENLQISSSIASIS